MDRIVLSGMQFFGYHGTRPEETTLGQRFEVDVTVGLDLQPAAAADDLTLGVDYARFHDIARAVVITASSSASLSAPSSATSSS